jgi:hypothetical protein
MLYKIKVLIVAAMIYIAYKDCSAKGAVQQAECIVREVDEQCSRKRKGGCGNG